jgi:cytoskeletal protein RodZ
VTLGQELKEKRVALGRSLDQIAASTKIHLKILQAIEEDRYTDLPARAFTRGFIVNYAKALKLDSDALLKSHHDFLEQKFSERPDRDQGHQGYAFEGKELEQNKRWTWIGLSAAGIFALAVVIVFKPGNHKRKEKHKDFEAEVATDLALKEEGALTPIPSPILPDPSPAAQLPLSSQPIPTASPPPSSSIPSPTPQATPSPEASPTATPNADKLNKGDDLKPEEVKFKIVVQTEGDTWVRYRSDQKPIGVIILRQGRSIAVKAKERILFEASPSAKLKVRVGSGEYTAAESTKFEISGEGQLKPYSGSEMGKRPLSDEVPAPRSQ